MNITHSLEVNKLRLPVFLGVSSKERARGQLIEISFTLTFDDVPQGCFSDNIEDTISYTSLVKKIRSVVEDKSYCLLEHITEVIRCGLMDEVRGRGKVELSVSKLTPPIPSIFGGVTYHIKEVCR